ncbi:amylo-alpha-1,6-glucosidase [Methanocella arvoryzae]|uniref:Predicted amylo-alpha-1,6-glucosidase n=1 Tax=Methanocella arvoryzae (strain DSM 22066 / NBRC 105507 / MRE50) TaxID=351160 RepID=Q0W6H0_METAR|nr:glycogen debranching N-terminal domain-containing protein [Methanocella arvoryzae]CAJ36023.1 predicted amylo-alpha-1,6-glucosidase [Methanocella arvoryzae MRE50]
MREAALEYEESHAVTDDITDALVIREGNITLVTEKNGNIPEGEEHGYGLYHRDCRFLSGYTSRLNDRLLLDILSSDERDYGSTVVMTNRAFTDDRGRPVKKNTITVLRDRIIPGMVRETISITNHNQFVVHASLTLKFEADFNDIFTIRGITGKQSGRLEKPAFNGNTLVFTYHGKDGRTRTTTIQFDPAPRCTDGHNCTYQLQLQPSRTYKLELHIHVEEKEEGTPKESHLSPMSGLTIEERLERIRASYAYTMECCGKFGTDNLIFNRIFLRSLADLRLLNMSSHGHIFHSAGVPWYDALFGRDSIISAIQSMPYEFSKAKSTLRLLARYQSRTYDDWKDAEPGKILHELRVGEKANLNEIPMIPYYGSVDSTPLFLILLAEYIGWTGEAGLFHELFEHVTAAMEWMDNYADPGDMGFASYIPRSPKGLSNHGWKDSKEAISRSDGTLARPPVALSEVQGYFYMAKVYMAILFERLGEREIARRLIHDAHEIKRKFNQHFWMSEKGFYAQAIDKDGLCDVISSNPLQCLWTGIVDSSRAEDMVKRMFEPDMFTGWGIRTLSSREKRYSPLGYHTGTVWPFDNSIIALGLCRYGFKEEANRLLTCMYEAASQYPRYRLPELFGGYDREHYSVPTRYPVACSPQAWSAGTIPYMLSAALGFIPNALDQRLTLIKPTLPAWVEALKIKDLTVGGIPVSLEFKRIGTDTMVNVPGETDLDVVVHY